MDSGLTSKDLRNLGEVLKTLAENGGGGIWIEYDPHSTGEFRLMLSVPLGNDDSPVDVGEVMETALVTDGNLEFGLLSFIEVAQDRANELYGDGEDEFPGVRVA